MLRRVVPTPELQALVLRTLHRESHHNSAKSLKQAIRSCALWWPGLEESVRKFVIACPQCQVYLRKSRPQDKGAHHRDRIFTPGSCYAWYVDVMQINPPCANTGFTHVLIFVEESMKYTILRGFKGAPNTDDIKLCVRDRVIHQIFGVPRHFRSDGGPGFNGVKVEHNLDVWLRNQYGSIWITGTHYNPNAQHLAERYCGVVKARIAKSQFYIIRILCTFETSQNSIFHRFINKNEDMCETRTRTGRVDLHNIHIPCITGTRCKDSISMMGSFILRAILRRLT